MPGDKPLMPRIRMPRVTRPGRASRAASEKTTATKPKTPAKQGNGAEPAATKETKESKESRETNPAAKAADGEKTPDANVQERIEGLQGWMAEIERKQGRMSYFGAVALPIAIVAAGAALYFAITAKDDSATKGAVDALERRVDSLQSVVAKNSKDTQDAINNSIAQLQGSLQALQKQQAQNAANIATLQSQAAALSRRAAAAQPGAAATPGTTTTTPQKNP